MKFTIYDILPVKRSIIKKAGLKFDGNIDDKILEIINEMYFLGIKISKPSYKYCFENILNIKKEVIPKSFLSTTNIMFFVSSLGNEIDNQIKLFINQNKILNATILDIWASETIENLNKKIDAFYVSNKLNRTRRFSPGYGDLSPLINNNIINTYFANFIVKANPKSGMLTPSKSTVCIIGWNNES